MRCGEKEEGTDPANKWPHILAIMCKNECLLDDQSTHAVANQDQWYLNNTERLTN
jgi:hypothetical protein